VHLATGIPSIQSLGASTFEDFFRAIGSPGFERAKLLRASGGFEEIRYPLPGALRMLGEETHSRGKSLGAHTGGSDTGFVILRRFTHSTLRDRWRARFTPPRSTSLGEREWNLVCHMRAHGVGAHEPLAVGRGEGSVFAERSFIAVRELEGMLSLKEWARAELDPTLRDRIRGSLSLALEKLWRAGVWLPDVSADDVLVGPPHLQAQADPDCVARAIAALRSESSTAIASSSSDRAALKWGELPEVAFTEFRGGRLLANIAAKRKRALARELEDELRILHFDLELHSD